MSIPTVLDKILANTRRELAQRQEASPLAEMVARAQDAAPVRALTRALRAGPNVALIAEVKKASPSRGVLLSDFDPVRLARAYTDAGAAAISVLTDGRFFQGSLQFLQAIRREVAGVPPLLRKDFILESYQVYEARAHGADALLLIVAALDDAQLRTLLALTHELDMEALVEVHDEAELERALSLGAPVVGVNNRDLRDFRVDLATTERLAARLPAAGRPILVAESGIFAAADVARLAAYGTDAILVGEAIVAAPDITSKARELARIPRSLSGGTS